MKFEANRVDMGFGSGIEGWEVKVSKEFEIGSDPEPTFTKGDKNTEMNYGRGVKVVEF